MRELIQVADDAAVVEARRLLREYAAWVAVDLSFQDFETELAHLPGDYVPPKGRLLLARVDGEVAGCVAAHRWGTGICEMKRLFVLGGIAFRPNCG